MEQIEQYTAHHRRVAGWYAEQLAPAAGWMDLPVEEAWAQHAYWLYTVVLGPKVRLSRDEVMAELAKVGIDTRPVFYPMHVMEPFYEGPGRYPVAERLSERGLSLPTHIRLCEEDVAYIAAHLRHLCGV